jgi:hypothetical protein
MSVEHLQQAYFLRRGLKELTVNFFLNGLVGWIVFRKMQEVPRWGTFSFGFDLLTTAFFLPFVICLIATARVRRELRQGKLALGAEWSQRPNPYVAGLPSNVWLRAVVLGTLCLAPVCFFLLILLFMRVEQLQVEVYVALKALVAGCGAGIAATLGAWKAAADAIQTE